MTKIIIYLLFICLFSGCASYKYTYKISLENPIKSNRLYYENDTLSISFEFNTKGLTFDLFNKFSDGIRINWDEVSISENGQAKRIVHKETGMTKVTDFQPPTTIPPKTNLSDFIVSSDNIFFTNSQGKIRMGVSDVYPVYDYGNKKTRQKILKQKGQRITLFLPYYIRNIYHSKIFDFLIEDIIVKKS